MSWDEAPPEKNDLDWMNAPPEQGPGMLEQAKDYLSTKAADALRGQLAGYGGPEQKQFEPYAERGLAKLAALPIFSDIAKAAGIDNPEEAAKYYDSISNKQLSDTVMAQNAAAKARSPWAYGINELGGALPKYTAAAEAGGSLGIGALAGIEKYGSSDSDSQLQKLGEAGKTGAESALFNEIFPAAIQKVGEAGMGTYNAVAPGVKNAFARLRGISPETVSLYANPESKAAINDIATGFDNLHQGQVEHAQRVAEDLNARRSSFIGDTQNIINSKIDEAQAAARPIPLSPITDKLQAGKQALLPVGQVNTSAINRIGKVQDDLNALAQKNMEPVSTGTFIRNRTPGMAEGSPWDYAETPLGDQKIYPEQSSIEGKTVLNPFARNANQLTTDEQLSYLPEASRGYGENLGPNQRLRSGVYNQIDTDPNLIPVERTSAEPFLTPKQLNQLRPTLNREAEGAYNAGAGTKVPGDQEIMGAANTVRDLLDTISTDIRDQNGKITNLFEYEKALKRGGLTEQDIPAQKLVNILTAGPKQAAKETPAIQGLDQLLGTDLMKQRSLSRAAGELNPEGVWNKIMTGYSATPAILGTASTPFLGPIGPAVGLGVSALQSPLATKPLITGGVYVDKISRGLLENTMNFGKYNSVLRNAAAKGLQNLAVTTYVLQQTDPEFRKISLQGEDQNP